MTVFRAATLPTFFFAFHAGAKELKERQCTLPFFNPCQVHKFPHTGKFMHLIPLFFFSRDFVLATSGLFFRFIYKAMGFFFEESSRKVRSGEREID